MVGNSPYRRANRTTVAARDRSNPARNTSQCTGDLIPSSNHAPSANAAAHNPTNRADARFNSPTTPGNASWRSCADHPDRARLDSPDISSPDISSPDIDSPDIDSPDIDSPDIDSCSMIGSGCHAFILVHPYVSHQSVGSASLDAP